MMKFWAMLFIHGADHKRFGSLLVDWQKAYANKHHDLYLEDIYSMLDVMRVMPAWKKKKPGNNNSGNKESSKKEENLDESSFATKGSEVKKEVPAHIKCNCCSENHYAGDCGKKNYIARKDWFKTLTDKDKKGNSNTQVCVETDEVVGFSGLHIGSVHAQKNLEEIMHSGLTISLFKNQELVDKHQRVRN